MPNKDGTGPNGQGSKTGRGMWNCVDKKSTSDSSKGKFWRWLRRFLWRWNWGSRLRWRMKS